MYDMARYGALECMKGTGKEGRRGTQILFRRVGEREIGRNDVFERKGFLHRYAHRHKAGQ